jgi:hypothetical protein
VRLSLIEDMLGAVATYRPAPACCGPHLPVASLGRAGWTFER